MHTEVHGDTGRAPKWPRSALALANPRSGLVRVSGCHDYHFDYLKLRRKLEEDGSIWRAYYFNSTPNPPSDQQDAFHSWLRSAPPNGPGIITRLYQLKRVGADRAYMATCALKHRDRYDTLLLSSGDGDLLDAIEFLSEQGKRIELAVFREGVSTELQARADKIYWIDDFAGEVERD